MITKVNIKGEFETLRKSFEQQLIVQYDVVFHQLLYYFLTVTLKKQHFTQKETPSSFTLNLYVGR